MWDFAAAHKGLQECALGAGKNDRGSRSGHLKNVNFPAYFEMAVLAIERDEFHGEWNYRFKPRGTHQ